MANMMNVKFKGLGEIQKRINAQSLKGNSYGHADIGYTAEYAAEVHENMQVYHPNGQAKFLETAYRRMLKQSKEVIKKKLQQRRNLLDAIEAGGKVILNESNRLVPVDTGFLRSSGYVKVR